MLPRHSVTAGIAAAAGAVARLAVQRTPPGRNEQEAPRPMLRTGMVQCDDSSLRSLSQALLPPMVQYAELHGLLYADKNRTADSSLATQCPVAMLPFKIPADAFHEAIKLSPLWNALVDAVARDLPWLYDVLEPAAKADPFTDRLVKISKAVHAEGLRQKMMLGIHRSDYMLHESGYDRPRFLQVELNTIASSMASHAANTLTLHRYILSRYGRGSDVSALAIQDHFGMPGDDLTKHLPENATLAKIPTAISVAHHFYGEADAVVLFVVQDPERNFADQRWIEYALWENHGIRVVRKTLGEVQKEGRLDPASGCIRLGFGSGPEVAVVYFRAGYSPDDYTSEADWKGRLLLEQSLAIKCPSVDYQLVGAKKVQQALARPGSVERFVGAKDGAQLRTCFAGLWGLGKGEDDAAIIRQACKEPHGYVLKPQREGGGNNYYGNDVAVKLRELTVEERGAYILMQRILPKTQSTVMTRMGAATTMQGLSEFGFYSVYLGDGRRVTLSEHAGHLVRTKGEGVDEGGVAAGYAVISSPFLVT